jgi:predicted phosphoribosyltransferase
LIFCEENRSALRQTDTSIQRKSIAMPRAPSGFENADDDSCLPYADRLEAADALALALNHHAGRNEVVLAIPRGAVPMGARLAQRLDATLDLVPVRKLGAPYQPELAIGAVDGDGEVVHTPGLESLADSHWLSGELERQRTLLARRFGRYRAGRPAIELAGRRVIVVDDGLATGATMRAALGWVRRRHPAWVTCAVPVAETESLAAIGPLADEVACPRRTTSLFAISQYYLRFAQVSDDEVEAVLAAQASGRSSSKRDDSTVAP